ncbi:hypothetical protein [Nostoc sp. PA-18-2419]|uniref:hypothetical protein n=1 Tax=Nostoc sp. PA-18-2419 TaxID=2575443 RepID=UPI001674A696|nr:hypothetical protein [Nostoc sp. PA-18-2419]
MAQEEAFKGRKIWGLQQDGAITTPTLLGERAQIVAAEKSLISLCDYNKKASLYN